MNIDLKVAMLDLMSAACRCGGNKDRRRPFCLACFQRLPRRLRSRLAGISKSEYPPTGYADLYSTALTALQLEGIS